MTATAGSEEPDQSSSDPLFEIEVIRSSRRTKTTQARLREGVLEIRVPERLTPAQVEETVDHFSAIFERRHRADRIDLTHRARILAEDLDLPEASDIRWVSNQEHRWGSCTPSDRSIRLSDRLVSFPDWVIDYVIVHELAHLVVSDHSAAFHVLVDRYDRAERARGYLLAKSDQR